nr:hypothetical protein Csa_6G498680 [Ipomoea batatas]
MPRPLVRSSKPSGRWIGTGSDSPRRVLRTQKKGNPESSNPSAISHHLWVLRKPSWEAARPGKTASREYSPGTLTIRNRTPSSPSRPQYRSVLCSKVSGKYPKRYRSSSSVTPSKMRKISKSRSHPVRVEIVQNPIRGRLFKKLSHGFHLETITSKLKVLHFIVRQVDGCLCIFRQVLVGRQRELDEVDKGSEIWWEFGEAIDVSWSRNERDFVTSGSNMLGEL